MRLFVASVWNVVFAQIKSLPYLCSRNRKPSLTKARKNGRDRNDSVAQLVEQVTLNHWVVSSSLTGVTSKTSLDLRVKARRFLPSALYIWYRELPSVHIFS